MPILRVEAQYRNETRNLQRQERQKYSSFLWNMMRLDPGPRVTIGDLVGPNQDAPLDFKDESALNASVAYYESKSNPAELIQVLKYFATYLMQQARRETDAERQKFLLFKATDFARMIVQHSDLCVKADAEALVFGVFVALGHAYGEPFRTYARYEETVYQLMRRLQMAPQDLTLRLRLAEALVAQTSYLDALVQFHTMLRILVRRGDAANRQRGWIVARIGDLFQRLSDISSSRLKDARKLRSFISRYNRDFAPRGHELPRLQEITASQVTRIRQALTAEANRWYVQAANAPQLERRQRLRMMAQAAENWNDMGHYREALKGLEDLYRLWQRVPESATTLRDQAQYLKLLTTAAMHLKRRDVMDWGAREAAEVSGKLAAIDTRRREHEQARAAMLA
ncbi:MAG TPA: hypothetical protein VKB51_15030 [bacterium]|nr:hypothetical protein [bacterium]